MNKAMRNSPQERDGLQVIMSAYALAALPESVRAITTKALGPEGTIADAHAAALAILDEAPVMSQQCILSALIFLANPAMGISNSAEVAHG
jgi:hypothetical protein